jgi:pantoate--beta-alanine ligase
MDATIGAMTIGLVPVMGALHDGHLSLIRRSHAENDETIVAIVAQAGGDPLPETAMAEAREAGARIFYTPDRAALSPEGHATTIHVTGLGERFEGETDPGALSRDVTLVITLVNQLQPTRTYVGEKHLQLATMLDRVHRDLAFSGEIVPCPIVRDPDGLALSSYNAALSDRERAMARAIPAALFAMQEAALRGETDATTLLAAGHEELDGSGLAVDYLAVVDPTTFEPLTTVQTGARAIIAATAGATRILDNVHLHLGAGVAEAE